MAYDKKITYKIVDGFDHVVDERGNETINLRKLCWGDNPQERIDIRRWSINANGEENVGKGVSFMTENGPHVLTEALISRGFGDTRKVLNDLSTREDFRPALNSVLGEGDEYYDKTIEEEGETFYDPKTALF